MESHSPGGFQRHEPWQHQHFQNIDGHKNYNTNRDYLRKMKKKELIIMAVLIETTKKSSS